MREFKPKTLKCGKGQKEKSLENVVFSRLFGGGGSGIRTHVPVGKRFSRHNHQSENDGFCAMIKDDKRS